MVNVGENIAIKCAELYRRLLIPHYVTDVYGEHSLYFKTEGISHRPATLIYVGVSDGDWYEKKETILLAFGNDTNYKGFVTPLQRFII